MTRCSPLTVHRAEDINQFSHEVQPSQVPLHSVVVLWDNLFSYCLSGHAGSFYWEFCGHAPWTLVWRFFFMLSLPSLGSHIKLACYNELESTSFLFSERSYIDLVSLIADVFDKMIALDGFWLWILFTLTIVIIIFLCIPIFPACMSIIHDACLLLEEVIREHWIP